MNAFKRAWYYITRRKTKTILLMITFFLIGNLVILGLGISQAAENAKVMTRKSMNPVVSYEVDYDAYYNYVNGLTDESEIEEANKHYPHLNMSDALEIAKDERVKAFNAMQNFRWYSDGFETLPVGNEDKKAEHGGNVMRDEEGNEYTYQEPNVGIIGNMFPNMIEIADGTFEIKQGRFYDQSDIDGAKHVCLITEDIANQNNLHVGDTLHVTEMGKSMFEQAKQQNDKLTDDMIKHDFEIIGIYSTKREVDPNADNFEWMQPCESPKNIILAPLTTCVEMQKPLVKANFEQGLEQGWIEPGTTFEDWGGSNTFPSSVIYLINDPLEVDSFVADHTSQLPQYTKLNANNDTFIKMARPLDTLSFFSNIIVWIVVINAIVIISLVTALTLKTRQYEMGVLVSLGVSKVKVILQLFYELILIAVIGFALASVSGSLIAGQVGEMVLNYQTEANAKYEDQDENHWTWSENQDYFTEVTQDDLLNQYHVSVSPKLIGEIYILGAGVVLLAIIVPSAMIMRLNPKQILLEQN